MLICHWNNKAWTLITHMYVQVIYVARVEYTVMTLVYIHIGVNVYFLEIVIHNIYNSSEIHKRTIN